MPPPQLTFLDGPEPLAVQVAEFLVRGACGRPWDLSATRVWVPTAGAGRRIRFAATRMAAAAGTGVLAPEFAQPMQAVLNADEGLPLATRAEQEAAWAQVIGRFARENMEALFPRSESIAGARAQLGAGGILCDLCDLLAEGGIDPGDPGLERVCGDDAGRWEQIRLLHRAYLRVMDACGLKDPNARRLEEIQAPRPAAGTQRLVIACIPDLPRAAAAYAEALARMGIEVAVLVWKPGSMGGGFDAWGRPLPDEWTGCNIALEARQIVIVKDPEEEASRALRFLTESAEAGDYALVLADPSQASAFGSEILRLGGKPFLPDGERLTSTEAGIIACEWIAWQADKQLRTVRRLLECPHFARWLGSRCGLTMSQLLAACDDLLADVLAETLAQAGAFFQNQPADEGESLRHAQARSLVEALAGTADTTADRLIREAWSRGGEGLEAAREVVELWETVSDSPVFSRWTEGLEAVFLRALKAACTFGASEPGDVELAGWLEAPWLDAGRVAVCGCIEGRLPASVTEHAFLPDSKRKALGLLDNVARGARDAYLLTCLRNVRPPEDFRCSFSKFSSDGSPSLPSSLLLRCSENGLPARVLEMFKPVDGGGIRPRREAGWPWQLPDALRRSGISRISPTGFKEYLACPFRFYFKRVLHLEEFDPRAREMDAMRFGSLIHKAVEDFAKTTPAESDAGRIEATVFATLDAEACRLFGPQPSAAVRVQLEAARVRLRAFARVQAASLADGWRIIEAERKISADGEDPLRLGGLAISAQIDRIEEHPDLGLRIVDYKTYATPKKPAQTHLGSPGANRFLPEAAVSVDGKDRCWVDLQLPLYRHIAEQLLPGRPVRTAYFILPADPSQTAIAEFEMSDEVFASAIRCAGAIADRVRRGVFWPPQPPPGNWDDPFAPLFLNGSAEAGIAPETIVFLKGQP